MKLRWQHSPLAAFTLIEIAIAIGVIAVALIAIIGVLPAGMQVQRDNRQDTIINGDGAYLLEAIRNGAQNIPDLTNFCELVDNQVANGRFTSLDIIQMLSEPGRRHTNVFRAITGPAAQRGVGVPTFQYVVWSEIYPQNVNTNLPHAGTIERTTYDVRLVFFWPVLPRPNGNIARLYEIPESAQRHVIRTIVSGTYPFVQNNQTNFVFNAREFVP